MSINVLKENDIMITTTAIKIQPSGGALEINDLVPISLHIPYDAFHFSACIF